jgi:hypothetical protein
MREGIVPTKSRIVLADPEIVSVEFETVLVESGMVPMESERVSEWREINYELININ